MTIESDPQIRLHICRMKEQVRGWPRRRWWFLIIGFACFAVGVFTIGRATPYLFRHFSLLEKLEIDKKPEGMAVEWWLLAESRRAASVLERRNTIVAMALIESVVGILITGLSLIVLVPLRMHWRHGGMELQNARLLLMLYDELHRPGLNAGGDST